MTRQYSEERTVTTELDDAYVEPRDTAVAAEHTDVVTTDPYAPRRTSVAKALQFVYLIFGVIEALIAIRFVLLLLGANPNAGFTSFIYGVTRPLVAPFEGIFGAPNLTHGVFDPASLVALVVYPLLGWVIYWLLWIALGEDRTAIRTHRRSVDQEIR